MVLQCLQTLLPKLRCIEIDGFFNQQGLNLPHSILCLPVVETIVDLPFLSMPLEILTFLLIFIHQLPGKQAIAQEILIYFLSLRVYDLLNDEKTLPISKSYIKNL